MSAGLASRRKGAEMRDIVERLRMYDSLAKAIRREWGPVYVMNEAAEEIERLRSALQDIANSDERNAEVQRSSHCKLQQIGRLLPNSAPPRSNPLETAV